MEQGRMFKENMAMKVPPANMLKPNPTMVFPSPAKGSETYRTSTAPAKSAKATQVQRGRG